MKQFVDLKIEKQNERVSKVVPDYSVLNKLQNKDVSNFHFSEEKPCRDKIIQKIESLKDNPYEEYKNDSLFYNFRIFLEELRYLNEEIEILKLDQQQNGGDI